MAIKLTVKVDSCVDPDESAKKTFDMMLNSPDPSDAGFSIGPISSVDVKSASSRLKRTSCSNALRSIINSASSLQLPTPSTDPCFALKTVLRFSREPFISRHMQELREKIAELRI